ncbi:MAG: DUF6428 family protein [Chthoniobacterales bacterium]|jgi:Family of unknown function (DUF6428)
MTLAELKKTLRLRPEAHLRFVLPNGEQIPPHFHLTEVGHVSKKFVDCGGTFREREACVLQTYVAEDFEHRLEAGRFADILDLGRSILPNDALEVELEWDCCVISQYPIASGQAVDGRLEFQLEARHTDCLAKQKCGCEAEEPGASAACCQAAGR